MSCSFSLQGLFSTLALPGCRQLASQVLSFLSGEDLQALCEGCPCSKFDNYFLALLHNARFLSQFINRTDKSLYFTFFAEPQYKAIEIAQVAALAQADSPFFIEQYSNWRAVNAMLTQCVPAVGEDMELLGSLLTDPELPLPKLKRETQGMYCSSPFQLFLVDCAFRQEQEEFFCFQGLREFLGVEREEAYVRQFMNLVKQRHGGAGSTLRRVMQVRYTPYEVTATNFKDFLLEDNELHNFIVGLFALTDVMVESTHAYISKISDPLHRLVQLLLRYSIFRNFVLSVQQYLSFAFKIYDSVYHDSIEQDPKKPQFRFWRPALTKWFLKMDYLHQQGMQVYFHCLIRLRNRHLCNALAELAEEDQQTYGKMRNKTELNAFEFDMGKAVYGEGMGASSDLGQFFDEHMQNYEMLVMQFNEYLVDVSVNEQTVHWCGHSRHQLEKPYLQYEQLLLKVNQEYMQSLMAELTPEQKHKMVKIDFQYLSVLQIKNRTLKMMVQNANNTLQLTGENAVRFDFDEADRKLQFFNAKALILASVDQDERPFYSIPPLCSAQKLIDMLDTNDSSNNNSEQETFQYLSEEQNQGNNKTTVQTTNPKKQTKEQFEEYDEELRQVLVLGKKPMVVKKIFAEDMQCQSLPQMLSDKRCADKEV